jgi:hypothetical protein
MRAGKPTREERKRWECTDEGERIIHRQVVTITVGVIVGGIATAIAFIGWVPFGFTILRLSPELLLIGPLLLIPIGMVWATIVDRSNDRKVGEWLTRTGQ